MNLQLQKGRSDHYCFVSDTNKRGIERAKTSLGKRGEIRFTLEFVRAEHIVPGDKHSDVETMPESNQTMTLAEFAAWWAANPEWRVVDV